MTFAALILAIAGSLHGFSFLTNPMTGAEHMTSGTAFWVMVDIMGGLLSCALAVIYLRHLLRSPAAPPNRTAWTLAILLLGPFAMPFYWWLYARRVPHSASPMLHSRSITEDEAGLLAAVSIAPPGHRDTP